MNTQERRQREAEERRRTILKAARVLFWKHGYAATTMPQIAKAAELAHGTVYLYFKSKDALYTELLLEGYDRLETCLRDAIAGPGSGAAHAARLIDEFFAFARKNPEYFNIMFFLLQEAGRGGLDQMLEPAQLSRLLECESRCKAMAASVLRELSPKLSPEALAVRVDAVWSMLSGAVFHFRGEREFAAVTAEVKRLVLAAIQAEA